MDRIEKVLVFVVVATIVVIVTLALSNSGESPSGNLPAKTESLADHRDAADLPLAEDDLGPDPQDGIASEIVPDAAARPAPAPAGGAEPASPAAARPEPAGPAPAPPAPAPAPKPAWNARYVVQKGDSFWSIAEAKYSDGKHWIWIRDHNKDVDPENVQPGTVLVLPPLDSPVKAVRTPALELPKAAAAPSSGNVRTVTLQKGEHIYAVLRRENLTHRYDEILRLNSLDRAAADRVQPGFVLRLPTE